MATLDITQASRDGILADAGDPASAGGDRFPNTGKELLVVTNGSGDPIDVVVETTIEVDGQAVADLTVTVAAGKSTIIGPFPISDYSDEVAFSVSLETDIDVQVIQVNPGV